jgi:hydrogenase maturation protease
MTPRILIAGIGNIFLGDDGFGVEVVRRLAARSLLEGIRVEDFGIRGMDLAYALLDPYDAVIFVDAVPRGEPPGTLYVIEPNIETESTVTLDGHGMDPVKVLALARVLGAQPTRTFLVGCEPGFVPDADSEDMVMELSAPVQAAIEEAVRMVESLVAELVGESSSEHTKRR